MRRWRRWAVLGVAVLACTARFVEPAHATMTGPCTATVNGEDVASRSASSPDDAIDLGDAEEATVTARSTGSIGGYRVQLEYAGIRWTVAKGRSDDNTWTRSVKVDDYARYGAGLYRVHGVSDGATTCDGVVLVKVGGSPLTTPAGLVASAFVLLGVANAALTVRNGRKAA